MHRLVQKPVSATQMQLTHATRSPRARQVAGRVVCRSEVDITAGINPRDSAATEKSFLELVFEGLCGATVTLVERLDCSIAHSWYTFASQSQSWQRDSAVFCAVKTIIGKQLLDSINTGLTPWRTMVVQINGCRRGNREESRGE